MYTSILLSVRWKKMYVPLNKKYIKKLDFELSSLKLDVFMYVVS